MCGFSVNVQDLNAQPDVALVSRAHPADYSDVVAGDLPLHICFILGPGGQYKYTLLLCVYVGGGWQENA